MAYRSTHTGNQIDTAVTKVNTKEVVVKFANVEGSPSDNAALDSAFLKPSDKGVANGVASLDSNGKVPTSQMNDAFLGNVKYQGLWNANTNTPELESTPTEGQKGFYWIVSVSGTQFETDFQVGDWIIAGTDSWQKIDNTDAVTSVEGRTGNVTVISDSVGSGITSYTWSANKLTNEFNKKQDELTPIAPLKIEDVTEGSNTYKAISVQYDNSTIKKNGSNQLYADLSSKQDVSTAVTHTENTAVGSTTQPVYIASNGAATAVAYTLGKSVPSDAVFTDTTYSAFTGADGSTAGTSGLVPQPAATDNTKFLKGDGTWATVEALPSQTSQSGKFLTTDGSAASWANIPTEIPSQTSQSGKFLTTDGSVVSWANIPTEIPSQTGNSGKFLTTDGTDVSWAATPVNGAGLAVATINNTAAPTLSENGTMGGSSAACEADQDSSNAWKAFARNSSYTWGLKHYPSDTSYITYYTPEAKILASLSVSYSNSGADPTHYATFQATVQGSTDNSTWETIGTFSGGKTEQPYSTTTFKPSVFKEYKYFKTSFTTNQYYDTEGIRIDVQFGTLAYEVNVDNNTVKISSKNNKLYVPEILPDVDVPLAYSSISVGGMTAYTVTNGYLVPTYTSNFQAYFSSGDSYVNVNNSNKPAATSVEEAFYQTSYIDIPCDIFKLVKKVRAGELTSVDCLFSSLTGNNAYQSPVWIAGNWDGAVFTPLLFGYAASMMGGAVTFLTGGYTAGGEYSNGFTADSTTYTYGNIMLNEGAGFAIRYDGSTWQVICSYTDPYGYESMQYHTTTVTNTQIDKLAQINVVRYINMSGSSTAANNPIVASFGYNNGTWTPGDNPVNYNTLVLSYDNDTLKVNGSNKLYADVQGGDTLPSQTGNAGKFLTTDGTDASWATVSSGGSLPSQTGNAGKFLTTDGTDASWATVSGNLPTQTGQSGKFLTTDGTDASWADVDSFPAQSGNSGKFLTTDGTDVSWANVSGSLPTQTGQSGKFLTTDGTDASWVTVTPGDTLPSQSGNSGKFLTTNGTTTSWATVSGGGSLPSQTGNAGKYLTTDGTDASWSPVITFRTWS